MAGEGAGFKVDPAILEAKSKEVMRVHGELIGILNGLRNNLAGLQGSWQGGGARSFTATMTAWDGAQKVIHQTLLETAQAVKTGGASYAGVDANAQVTFNRVNVEGGAGIAPVSLPLGGPTSV